MATPKLTETTNDRLAGKGNGAAIAPPRITAPHEPLSTGEVPAIQQSVVAAAGQAHIQTDPNVAPQPLKIALIGTAPSSRMLAPFNDPAWKIWGCSAGNMNVLPRIDAWFEIHGNMLWPEHKHYGEPYLKWLSELKVPVFMQDKSFLPHAKIFPMRELVADFGGDFFTSTFAWMMAFAIKCGAAEIALYGIDMASRDEYILQRPGFYYFKEMARQRGVKVSAPTESDIMQPPGLYGYSDVTPFGRKLYARRKEIRERIAQMKQQRAALDQSIFYLEGADEDNDYTISIWMGAQDNQSPLMPQSMSLPILPLPPSLPAIASVTVTEIARAAETKVETKIEKPPPKRKANASDLHHRRA